MATRKNSCRKQVSDFIKEMILAGEIKPGERLKEAYIAAATGLSRAPIREALVELCRDGILDFEPNRGVSVTRPTADSISARYTICALLEGFIAASSLAYFTPRILRKLEALLEEMRAVPPGEGAYAALNELDFKFHDLILGASDNVHLTRFARMHNGKLEHFFFSPFWEELYDPEYFHARHKSIVEALKAKDPGRVEAAMREHYAQTTQCLAKFAQML